MLRTDILAPIACAIVLIVLTTLKQGQLSERWGTFPELEEFAKLMDDVPITIGDWKGKNLPAMDDRTMKMAGAIGALSREYSNHLTGQTVNVHIVCGRMQDVFYHTPDRCYPAAGFSQEGAIVKEEVTFGPNKSVAEFKMTKYVKSSATSKTSTAVQIMWSWSADGPWQTPESPKLEYAGRRALYKIYIEHPVIVGEVASQQPPGIQFAEAAMGEITRAFFPTSKAAEEQIPKDPTKAVDSLKPSPEAVPEAGENAVPTPPMS